MINLQCGRFLWSTKFPPLRDFFFAFAAEPAGSELSQDFLDNSFEGWKTSVMFSLINFCSVAEP